MSGCEILKRAGSGVLSINFQYSFIGRLLRLWSRASNVSICMRACDDRLADKAAHALHHGELYLPTPEIYCKKNIVPKKIIQL